ncbi:pentatricopeptide repeat-containing protein At1g32415, mitochondrial-like [Zingiber officinale]|uniref:Pentatricopeptide repeat-containing protein n=1 Tax=Zingiber officinale TaxID=94328 RepID=A0A8J5LH83_ZINOF|nr:pentatricopeptide repeat-containing protein At1g32415, mitochondrial-like [Zingiber officinale]KAG6511993.1 hypothetical protein ZIOFF_030082 [Zingiber officinale]
MPPCRFRPSAAALSGDLPLLQCLRRNDLPEARCILESSAHDPTAVVRWTAAISRFARAGFLPEAVALFDLMPRRNVVTWNALISAHLYAGSATAALDVFYRMPSRNVVSYTSALCALARDGRIEEARALFSAMPERNVISYNAMLSALVRTGDLASARNLFDEMPHRNAASGNALLAGYAERGRMPEARSLFEEMVEQGSSNVVSWTSVISGYGREGKIWEAYDLFRGMIPERNVVCWTAMIGGFAWNGFHHEAVALFLEMKRTADGVKPNEETMLSLIYACAGLGFPLLGKQVHAHLLVQGTGEEDFGDGRLTKGLIHMYSRFGHMDCARHLFDGGADARDAVCWNSMIEGYARIGRLEEVRRLFDEIAVDTRRMSWITMMVTWTTVISAYFNAGEVEEARRLFDRMPQRDATAWTALISGLVRNERMEEAFAALAESRADGFAPGDYALASLLGAVGSVARLEIGEQVHGLVTKVNPAADPVLRNALVSMYAKSGDMDGARRAFEELPAKHDVVSWNAIVMGLAHHGRAAEALRLFEAMRGKAEPDAVTCLGALTACDHAGMVDRAEEVLRFMAEQEIPAGPEHLACVVGMLVRAGRFDAAEQLASAAPAAEAWGLLLGTCFIASEKTVGGTATRRLLWMGPLNPSAHKSSGHVYGEIETQEDNEAWRKGLRKRPGCSWVGGRGNVHVFVCGDRSHPRTAEIYSLMNQITCEIRNSWDD